MEAADIEWRLLSIGTGGSGSGDTGASVGAGAAAPAWPSIAFAAAF